MPSNTNTMHFTDYLQSMLKTHRSDDGRAFNEESYGYAYYGSKNRGRTKREKWRAASSADSCSVTSNQSRRRRVHFAPVDSKSYIVPSSEGTIVSSLPCTNDTGVSGRYYGRVNDHMQPHGSGALIYRDGSARTAIWSNGTPVEPWVPTQKILEQQARHDLPLPKLVEAKSRRSRTKSKKRRRHSKERSSKEQSHRSRSLSTDRTMSMSSSSLQLCDTYLPHLEIGDKPTKYDVLESDPRKINLLQVHDFAWIQRSGGRWSYAIIAEIESDFIRFVVDVGGSTKALSRKHWASCIRLVNPPRKPVEDLLCRKKHGTQHKQEAQPVNYKPMRNKSRSKSKEPKQQQQRAAWPFLRRSMGKGVKPRLPPMNFYISSPPITEEEQRKMATSSATLHRSYHGSQGVEPWMDQSDPDLGGALYAHA